MEVDFCNIICQRKFISSLIKKLNSKLTCFDFMMPTQYAPTITTALSKANDYIEYSAGANHLFTKVSLPFINTRCVQCVCVGMHINGGFFFFLFLATCRRRERISCMLHALRKLASWQLLLYLVLQVYQPSQTKLRRSYLFNMHVKVPDENPYSKVQPYTHDV